MVHVSEPTVEGKYVHWDKLRHLTPPGPLTHEDWWLGLKFRRMQSRSIPLVDTAGLPFSFNLADPLTQHLHEVDSLARGVVLMPEPITNPETRDRYLIRSLIDEAITSSQLEGASTTREVAKRMIREGRRPRDPGEQMIANNYAAMKSIIDRKDRDLTRDMIFDIHRIVTDGTLGDSTGAGRFRRPDEPIIVGDDQDQVFHVPPPAGQLEARMASMCDFANGRSPAYFIHPMLRSIILHFWLAYDHPFIDGNGRSARALFYWSMLRHGYWLLEFISISKIILQGPAKYGMAFLYTETDENDLTYFLHYHAEVIRRAIAELHDYLNRRMQQVRRTDLELRGLTRLNHRQRDVIGHAVRHPGQRYTIETHRNSHNVVYETARTDLMDLVDQGLFDKRKVGKFWHFSPVSDLEERLKRP